MRTKTKVAALLVALLVLATTLRSTDDGSSPSGAEATVDSTAP